MFPTVVVAVDGSLFSLAAVQQTPKLGPSSRREIVFVHVRSAPLCGQ